MGTRFNQCFLRIMISEKYADVHFYNTLKKEGNDKMKETKKTFIFFRSSD